MCQYEWPSPTLISLMVSLASCLLTYYPPSPTLISLMVSLASCLLIYYPPSPTLISLMVSLASCLLTYYPPNLSTRSNRRFPHPSSDLCHNCLRHWKDAPSSSHHKVCPPTWSAPSERLGYWWGCGSNIAPKHARKHETRPPRIKTKSSVSIQTIFGLICADVSKVVRL